MIGDKVAGIWNATIDESWWSHSQNHETDETDECMRWDNGGYNLQMFEHLQNIKQSTAEDTDTEDGRRPTMTGTSPMEMDWWHSDVVQ